MSHTKSNSEKRNNRRMEPKVRKLKLSQTTLKKFAIIGIHNAPATKTATLLTEFIILSSAFASITLYIIIEAESFAEYTQSAYILSMVIQISFDLLILIVNGKRMFEFIDNGESVINTVSEYRRPNKSYSNI